MFFQKVLKVGFFVSVFFLQIYKTKFFLIFIGMLLPLQFAAITALLPVELSVIIINEKLLIPF